MTDKLNKKKKTQWWYLPLFLLGNWAAYTVVILTKEDVLTALVWGLFCAIFVTMVLGFMVRE